MKAIKFLISGVSAASVEYASFLVLQHAMTKRSLFVSQSVSFLCGFVVSFSLNKLWVFKSSGNTSTELMKYLALLGVNLIATNVALGLLVNRLDIVHWLSKIIVMAMVAVWNYYLFQKIVFKSPNSKKED